MLLTKEPETIALLPASSSSRRGCRSLATSEGRDRTTGRRSAACKEALTPSARCAERMTPVAGLVPVLARLRQPSFLCLCSSSASLICSSVQACSAHCNFGLPHRRESHKHTVPALPVHLDKGLDGSKGVKDLDWVVKAPRDVLAKMYTRDSNLMRSRELAPPIREHGGGNACSSSRARRRKRPTSIAAVRRSASVYSDAL